MIILRIGVKRDFKIHSVNSVKLTVQADRSRDGSGGAVPRWPGLGPSSPASPSLPASPLSPAACAGRVCAGSRSGQKTPLEQHAVTVARSAAGAEPLPLW